MSQPPAIAEVEDELRNFLLRQKFEAVMTELRGKYPVEIVGQAAPAEGATPDAGAPMDAAPDSATPDSGAAPATDPAADPAASQAPEPATAAPPQN